MLLNIENINEKKISMNYARSSYCCYVHAGQVSSGQAGRGAGCPELCPASRGCLPAKSRDGPRLRQSSETKKTVAVKKKSFRNVKQTYKNKKRAKSGGNVSFLSIAFSSKGKSKRQNQFKDFTDKNQQFGNNFVLRRF